MPSLGAATVNSEQMCVSVQSRWRVSKCREEFHTQNRKKTNLIHRLELLGDSKDSLNVVVAQFLDQMGNGGVILENKMS